eukprot:GEMP01013004.1.p1 GENE.GEMP01013004.1~~GEMP01013004.1.p1  ORF type:complete len:190 (+),score=43.26 GEMP01013004.1:1646-2215(+)
MVTRGLTRPFVYSSTILNERCPELYYDARFYYRANVSADAREDVAGGWWERDLERRDRRRDSRSRGHRRRGDSHERRGRRRERSRYRERSRSRRRDRSDDVCRQYQRSGKCEYGEKCKFEHDDPKSREKETKEKVREKLREKSRAKSREKKSRAKSREKKSRSKSRRKSRSKSRSEAPKPGAAFTFDDY